MTADLQLTCCECGNPFWWMAGEQQFYGDRGLVPPKRCRDCRAARKTAPTGSALVPVRPPAGALAPLPTSRSSSLVRQQHITTDDLRQLMETAFSPVVIRRRTFWEWLDGVDLQAQQLKQKLAASDQAIALTEKRTKLINGLREMILATRQLEDIEVETQQRALQAQVNLLKLEFERLQLQEQIEAWPETHNRQHELERLEAMRRHRGLVRELSENTDDARARQEFERDRTRLRLKARARREVLGDAFEELENLSESDDLDEAEKALAMRAVMDTYGLEIDDLPDHLQEFLTNVDEDDEDEEDDDDD